MQEKDFIHLCQPDPGKSCGACCGLYNYAVSNETALSERLQGRTRLFRSMVKGPEDLAAFSEKVKSSEDGSKRYDVIYCCEYLGFLDGNEKRVGCLLHPLRNGGADLRDASFYGRELCDGHFCPSYHYISGGEKLALLNILDGWYLYGLCITDIDLVKEYFRLVSEAVGEMPSPACFKTAPLREAARRFFSLKINWPFRSASVNRLGKYYFDGSQYMIHHIDYEVFGVERSRFNKIFLSLSSEFADGRDVKEAEVLIQNMINEFVLLYEKSRIPAKRQ